MDPRSSNAQARGDNARPSSIGGGDPDAVLRSVTQQVMAKMARSLEERSCTIEQFTHMKPPSFAGGANSLVAENWVQDMEDMLAVLPCTYEQTRLARLLKEQRPKPVAVTWSRFREIFFEKYSPTTVKSAKAAEFLHLTQGSITVQKYVARFIELSRFATYLVPDEEKMARKFEEGLRQSLFEQVIGFWAQTFCRGSA
ncbi:uncharacterized protein LOC131160936 [Malania oleifera]|uniref:uncharacterized protein LOC131160936 n=1 Tax=Malania oleifera TaxID=397392 RepID=UPI0025AE1E54|nr:uncharacterized protein LOC131160936 [Malania oleifera]